MYNENQTKESLPELPIRRNVTQSAKCDENPRTCNDIKRKGDIDIQMNSLRSIVSQLEDVVGMIIIKIEPILEPPQPGCGSEKDTCKEEQLSPVASDIRQINYRLEFLKSNLLKSSDRIQL